MWLVAVWDRHWLMEARSLQYVAEGCGGHLVQGPPGLEVCRVCTDSRQTQAGDLFVALAGEHFDGHGFVSQAFSQGARAVLVRQDHSVTPPAAGGIVAVPDTLAALGRLAARYRQDFDLPLIAVAGSNGKTSTKELIAAVLRQQFPVCWSEASFNNHIGVPVTLLKLERNHRAGVLEIGTNHAGELAPLVRMIQPRYGVITSIGREHLEFFGSLEGVIEEEGWLAELLPSEGKLFVNGDCLHVERMVQRTRAAVVRVGIGEKNTWRARRIRVTESGTAFEVVAPDAAWSGEYRLKLIGRHQAVNGLLAIALGAELGLDREQISCGLANCATSKMRLQIWDAHGVRILDDAYNANADSMLAALDTLSRLECRGRRVAVLGDMAELGSHSRSAHAEVGRRSAQIGLHSLFAVGQMASILAGEARAAGLAEVHEFATVEAAVPAVKNYVKPGDLVLLKASRAARLERIGDVLR